VELDLLDMEGGTCNKCGLAHGKKNIPRFISPCFLRYAECCPRELLLKKSLERDIFAIAVIFQVAELGFRIA